jgi:Na+/H+ antiporter NhaD/arsenite permease-like protein
MTCQSSPKVLLGLILLVTFCLAAPSLNAASQAPGDRLSVAGSFLDEQGEGIKEVEVEVLVNGYLAEPTGEDKKIITGSKGSFLAEFAFPAGTLSDARVIVMGHKPNWRPFPPTLLTLGEGGLDEEGHHRYQAQGRFSLRRDVTPAFWIATLALIFVYVIIAAELMHRTLAAFLGATLIMFVSYTFGTFNGDYFIISFKDAMHAIDLNVIFLLMGMMIIVGVLKKTGLFQWLAYKSFALARGNVFILSCILMVITAVASAFLDNVTTMLLILPVTIELAVTLNINPIALLIPEVFASNVGGAATLIGDPPNILIGSYAKLTFVDFLINLTVIVIICMVFTLIYYVFWYRRAYQKAEVKDVDLTIAFLREEYKITDFKLLAFALGFLSFTIFLFVIHGVLHMEPSIAALTGAMFLLAVTRVSIVEMLEHEVEWPTLMFFVALFIVIAGAEETGLIQVIAAWVRDVSQGDLKVAMVMVLWVSAIASAIVDNIPFTATMLPIVAFLNHTIPGAESKVLWWALALGACLGGNGTMIGASANVVTVGLAEKAGYPISFMAYFKACFIPMLITVFLAMLYLFYAFL